MSIVDDLRRRAEDCRALASSSFGLGKSLTGWQRQGKADAYDHAAELVERDPDLVSRAEVVAWPVRRARRVRAVTRPTIYVTNHASLGSPGFAGGTGWAFTIMARPRPWEWGAGRVPDLTPDHQDLVDVQQERITLDQYRERYEALVRPRLAQGNLGPGQLTAALAKGRGSRPVPDGGTVYCSCSRAAAAEGRCHRVWAAHMLREAGWRVLLDGADMDTPPAPSAQGTLF